MGGANPSGTPTAAALIFLKEAEGLPIHTMAELVDNSIVLPIHAMSNSAIFETPRVAGARSSRRVS